MSGSASVPRARYDAVIVGAGPNGLAAANVLGDAGLSTAVFEARQRIGGGCRTSELTLPGYRHDDCAAVHPLGIASPYLSGLGLHRHGLEWVEPRAPLAHVMDDGTAVLLEHSLEDTAAELDVDGDAYRQLLGPVAEHFTDIADMFLGPLRPPRAPLTYLRFGLRALASMQALERQWFRGKKAGALLAGIAAHAMVPLNAPGSCAFALILGGAGHAKGWPLARGGSAAIVNALGERYRTLGGDLFVGRPVRALEELPEARVYLLDVSPRQLPTLLGDLLPEGYRARLERYRYGPGVFKIDWALSGPIPWKDPRTARAGTVHLSGPFEAVARSAADTYAGRLTPEPFVLLAEPTRFDATRAPPGGHIAWAYCHVPHGDAVDRTAAIEAQIERHAPGFGRLIQRRATRNARQMEQYNPNYVGGDINGGAALLSQLFFRPVARLDPYRTPLPHVLLCSASTPPGGGVHGMCGYWAARSALRQLRRE